MGLGGIGGGSGFLGGMGGGGMGGMGPAGMAGLDIQMHNMPIVGSFFRNPMEEYQLQQFQQAAGALQGYRPEAAQTRMNTLRNAASAFQPAASTLQTMGGGGQMFSNPMGPSATMHGQPAAMGPEGQPLGGGGGGGMLGGLLGGGGIGGLLGGGGLPGMPGGGGLPGGLGGGTAAEGVLANGGGGLGRSLFGAGRGLGDTLNSGFGSFLGRFG